MDELFGIWVWTDMHVTVTWLVGEDVQREAVILQ